MAEQVAGLTVRLQEEGRQDRDLHALRALDEAKEAELLRLRDLAGQAQAQASQATVCPGPSALPSRRCMSDAPALGPSPGCRVPL